MMHAITVNMALYYLRRINGALLQLWEELFMSTRTNSDADCNGVINGANKKDPTSRQANKPNIQLTYHTDCCIISFSSIQY